jgi:N-acyl-D-aspartate/D-glutamate deacylase
VDGTGSPWYAADVGIRGGKIAKIGQLEAANAKHLIDARGLIIAPGFIDMMGQTATPMLDDPSTGLNLLTQGITTINAGEGSSAAPASEDDARRLGWRTMADYFQRIDERGLPLNVAQTVGHTQVRHIVLGDVDRRASESELKQMEDLVAEAMQAGAIGVSTALIYPPAASGCENWYRHVGQDWSKVIIGQTSHRNYASLAGQSVAEMARARGEDPWDTFFNLVRSGAFALPESMSEENKLQALREEFISFCTDVGPASSQIASHPRAFGSFPRLLSKYVRELGAIS